MSVVPDFFTPVSTNAIRLPVLQFTTVAEGRLVNTDILSSLGNANFSPKVAGTAAMFANGTALTSPVNMSLFTTMGTSITSILGTLPGIIAALTALMDAAFLVAGTPAGAISFPISVPSTALNGLSSLLATLQLNPIGQIEQALNNMITHLPTIAGVMNMSVKISAQFNLKLSFSDPCGILAPLIGGAIAAAVVSLSSLITAIEASVASGLAAIGGAIQGFMASLNAALSGITSLINGILSKIREAMNIFAHLSNAAILELMILEGELHCISGLFTKGLNAHLAL